MVAIAGRGWSLAPCLRALFDEADRRWPGRSRISDGSIGDADHQTRASDHNPDSTGDVLAGDLTDDKAAGCDADLFAEHLRTSRDPRVKYVICNGKVFRSYGTSAWQWTPYTGINGHFAHTHVSVLDTADAKNDTSSWFPYADAPDPQEDDLDATQARQLADIHAWMSLHPKDRPAVTGQHGVNTAADIVRILQDSMKAVAAAQPMPEVSIDLDAFAAELADRLGPALAAQVDGLTEAEAVAAVKKALREGTG